MKTEFIVHGTITTRGGTGGVHGLVIEAWDCRPCKERCLGTVRTRRDGSYRITFCPPKDGCTPSIFLRIRDREGRLLYDGADDCGECPTELPATVSVELARETLWWHNRDSLSWSAPGGALVDARVFDEIHEAVAAFAPERGTELCTLPPILLFDRLLEDAWGALQGDLDAGGRYRDALHALCGFRDCESASVARALYEDLIAHALERECPPEPECGEVAKPEPKTRRRCGSGCGCGCADDLPRQCPCESSAVDGDDLMLLLMAILQISCGHRPTVVRHATVLLEQVCQVQHLGALHRAATAALCGDDAARSHFLSLIELIDAHCCANEECYRAFACCATCIDEELERCLHQSICAWRGIDRYRITSVAPARACPGETIVVRGEAFGDEPGVVTFAEYGGIGPGPKARPTEWCCDQFSVVVPKGAGCGMKLALPPRTVNVCGRFLDVRPFGCAEAVFEGTAADILQFNVEGREEGDCIEPGTPLQVSWKTCAADRVRVQIVNEETGVVIDSLDPAPDRGSWTFDKSGFTSTARVQVRLRAEGACDPAVVDRTLSLIYQARPDLSVDGLEVTQAIQHYRAGSHLTDPADRGADNSLRLVTEKSAWVRAYLRSGQQPGFDGGDLPDVDGTLSIERRVGGIWMNAGVLPSQNGPIDARDAFVNYDTERGNINNSLNFVIPASMMTGLLRFTLNVQSPFDCPGNSASRSTTVDVNLQQTLKAAFITIGYNGPNSAGNANLNLPAPSLAVCQAETSWAMTTYPVSGAPNVRVAGTFVTNTPINDPRSCPGCCSPNWGPLLTQIAGLVTLDQAANPGNWAYYGIIANGIPVNVPGCNGTATGGVAGQPMTYAHEIGHQLGLRHARCGNAGTGNAAYPVYEPYDLPVDVPADPINTTTWTMASIGEYGLDINNGNIANPNSAEDFMSYCGPRWISKFTHDYLVNDFRLDPVVVPTGSGAATDRVIQDDAPNFRRSSTDVAPLIVLIGLVDTAGRFVVGSVARLPTRYHVGEGRPTRFRAQLIGEDGEVLTEDVVYQYSLEGCSGDHDKGCCDECAEPEGYMFKAMLDDVALGTELRIIDKDEPTWVRPCPSAPPKVSRARASATKDGKLRITWSASAEGGQPEAWLRWSEDGGETWTALAVGVTDNSFELPIEDAPSGSIIFNVLFHDGYSSVDATTSSIEIEPQPPSVTILYPGETDLVYDERQIHLWGIASTRNAESFGADQFVWYVDGAEAARGADVWVDNPGVGRHELELRVEGAGGPGTADTSFEVRG